jgi:hypothetical protein
VSSVEQCCAAIMESVTIVALIAYKRGKSCTGGTTNNDVDSSAEGANRIIQLRISITSLAIWPNFFDLSPVKSYFKLTSI